MYTVEDLCQRYSVTSHTVLQWIHSGQMVAVNVGRQPGARKPRWRVTEASLEAFEAARASRESPGRVRAPRRKRPDQVIDFY